MFRRPAIVLVAALACLVGCSGSGSGSASGGSPGAGTGAGSSAPTTTVPGATASSVGPSPGSTGGGTGSPGTTAAAPRRLPSGRTGPARPAEERGVTIDLFAAAPDVDPARIRGALTSVAAHGVNTVVVSVSELDLFNDAKLKATLDAAHDLGLYVVIDPFIGGAFRNDPAHSSAGVLAGHPEWAAISRHGVVGTVPAINSAAYRDGVRDTLERLLAYDVDGVVLDQPSYPTQALTDTGDYFPADDDAKLQFESRFGHELPPQLTQEVVQFRRDSMKSFLEDLLLDVRHRRPDVTTRVLLPGSVPASDTRAGTDDWKDLAAMQSLDALQIEVAPAPDDATYATFVAAENKLLDAVTEPLTAGMWIDAVGLGDAPYPFLRTQLEDARKHHVDQVVVALDDQQPNAHPDEAWAQIHAAFAGTGDPASLPPALSETTTTPSTPAVPPGP